MLLVQRIVVLLLMLPAIFFFSSCGSNNHSTTSGSSGSSSGSSGGSSGSSSGATGSTPTGTSGQSASPKFLYSSDNSGNRVFGYLVNATTGAISATSQGSAPTHTGPTRVAADSTGTHLYVINFTSKDLSAYSISRTDGSLTGVSGSPFAIGQTPTGVAVAPSGAFVYVTTFNTPTTPTSFVYAFAVQSNGSLTAVPGSPFAAVDFTDALAIDPQGKYLYVRSQTSPSKVGAYSIGSDGSLTPVPGSPYTEPSATNCDNGAPDMAIDSGGNFLLLPSFCEGLVIYRIDRTSGTLSLVNGSPFVRPAQGFPGFGAYTSVAIDPKGVYIWIADDTTSGLPGAVTDTWKLDANTGIPTFVETNDSACGLFVRSDPSGNFVYETSGFEPCISTQGVLGFNVNRGTGALGNISGSPWKAPNSVGEDQAGLAITP